MIPAKYAIDFSTSEGARLKAYLQERLEQLRSENDADVSPERTANTRGRIAEIKTLLSGAAPRVSAPSYGRSTDPRQRD